MTVDHSAAGQALGYLYQFDRATFRLFNADVDVIEVGIEDIDDVSEHLTSGKEIREQNKSTINKTSPLSDRSVALWKTLHIWAELVIEDPSIIERTEFHLVTNGTLSTSCLAKRISSANEETLSNKVLIEIRDMIPGLREDLKPFGITINKLDEDLFQKLITKVSIFDKLSSKFGGDLNKIQALRFYPQEIKVSLFDQANGWIKRKIIELVEQKKPPRILRKEFDQELQALMRRVSVASLSSIIEPINKELDFNKYESHGFVQQLDWINLDEKSIRDAIIHFTHAQNTRMKWTDNYLISDSSLLQYEEDLIENWKLVRRRVSRRNWETDEIEGQECLDSTLSEDSRIDNEVMPKTITFGNYHALAHFNEENKPNIGWHPKFEQRLRKDEMKS